MKQIFSLIVLMVLSVGMYASEAEQKKKVAYIVSDTTIPFWAIMARGIENRANQLGYEVDIYTSNNDLKTELENTVKAIKEKVSAIVVSPISSSSCVTVLKLAHSANIPVVISDIGTDDGEYLSYISSDNKNGAYEIGKVLALKMIEKNYQDGQVAIIAIPQKRLNGKERTAGFLKAMEQYEIRNADIRQQIDFSYEETYKYARELIENYPDLRAIWLQGSDKYKGALDAIFEAGKKEEILLITFDAEPEFLELIPQGVLVGAAMQQPFLMGEKAVEVIENFYNGGEIQKNIKLEILAVSTDNIKEKLPKIQRDVLGVQVQ